MDDLRLALLIIGLIIFVLIYAFGVIGKPRKKDTTSRVKTKKTEVLNIAFDPTEARSDYIPEMTVTARSFTRTKKLLGPGPERDHLYDDVFDITKGGDDLPITKGSSDTHAKTADDINATKKAHDGHTSLFITAPKGALFSGFSIHRAAKKVGMVFGDMDIFHYFGNKEDRLAEPMFSMANMYEPGSFDLEKIVELQTEGVVFFIPPLQRMNRRIVFEQFIQIVRQVADSLGGVICKTPTLRLTETDLEKLYRQFTVEDKTN